MGLPQPIETAPLDGTPIIGLWPDGRGVVWWDGRGNGDGCWTDGGGAIVPPTAWLRITSATGAPPAQLSEDDPIPW